MYEIPKIYIKIKKNIQKSQTNINGLLGRVLLSSNSIRPSFLCCAKNMENKGNDILSEDLFV